MHKIMLKKHKASSSALTGDAVACKKKLTRCGGVLLKKPLPIRVGIADERFFISVNVKFRCTFAVITIIISK